ncbi:hypothetical protein CPT_Muldoon_137 [Serratia phage Muldoon]|uniref:Uncharacterized protein n=1 Tax=Serratia phage Muldoon TaxID=2601678 RepID=A0A5P8PHE1_9CAUD|nr:hypothetical protein HYP94_gp252 [Serratia phage Muldoon]QFR56089.1 hypothetical protein CPT_Muldoon_137 [Serratia phage Muldoon]UNA02498.1 hypothetical protein [Serratia phage SP1]WDS61679.1 hypothetical protein [Cronobacter phage vB_Cdu_VP8]
MIYAKVTNPQNGYPHDQKKAKKLIELFGDNYLDVFVIEIGRSSTGVRLNHTACPYNSVNFSFYVKEDDTYTEIDIFKYNHPRIQYTYAQF